jgi:hypothetical protein
VGIPPTLAVKRGLLLDRAVNGLVCCFAVYFDHEAAYERKPRRGVTKKVEFGSLDVAFQNVDYWEA